MSGAKVGMVCEEVEEPDENELEVLDAQGLGEAFLCVFDVRGGLQLIVSMTGKTEVRQREREKNVPRP